MHPDPKLALHVCSRCDKSFANVRSKNKHVRKIHRGDEHSFQCDQCDIETTNRVKLDRHKLDVHIPKMCEKCKKYLENRVKWRLHRKTCTKKGGLKTASCAPEDVRHAVEEDELVEDGVEGNGGEVEEEQELENEDEEGGEDEQDREDEEDGEDEEDEEEQSGEL